MGRTTELRREVKTRFFPFMKAKGFTVDLKDAPTFFAFRKQAAGETFWCEIQWEKSGKPRFILNFGRGEPITAPTCIRGRLHPVTRSALWSTTDWFCQDRRLSLRLLGFSALRPPEPVVDSLISLFSEVETFWESNIAGPHIRLFPPFRPRKAVESAAESREP